MDAIIKHLVEITGHRDHELLNISVISALRELTQSEEARVLDVVAIGSKIYLRPKISIVKGKVIISDDSFLGKDLDEEVTNYPQLADGLAQKKCIIEGVLKNGTQVIWLPIWMNEKSYTCLEISNPVTFNKNAKDVMNGILIVYRNFQNLLDYSERDSLTGLLNRKTFDDNLLKILRTSVTQNNQAYLQDADVAEERRHNTVEKQHWLAVFDIDHFKRVNDQFGHLYGDEVLILLANIMRSSFRPGDKLFRFGGEEFVILLRSTTEEDAKMIFERFRHNVGSYAFPQVGRVTVSLGFARIDPFEPTVGIMGRADQALYFAKSHGRNRTCQYERLVKTGELKVELSHDDVEFF
jgi:diguanylate cyclase (GGDEF)-like protein